MVNVKMIRNIATDLDGTLFYPKRKIKLLTSKNTKFLRSFVANKKNYLILVSGRNITLFNRISKKVKCDDIAMIGCNGSVIYRGNKMIHEDPIPKEDVRTIYDKLKKDKNVKGVIFMTNKKKMTVTPNNINYFVTLIARFAMMLQGVYREKYKYSEKYLERVLEDDEVRFYKVMPIYGFGKRAHELARLKCEEINNEFGETLEAHYSGITVEIMKKDVNKANALKMLLNMLELEESETAVIGDSGNDIPLFEAFENSFCMKKAPEQVKSKAKHIVSGVHEIEKFL